MFGIRKLKKEVADLKSALAETRLELLRHKTPAKHQLGDTVFYGNQDYIVIKITECQNEFVYYPFVYSIYHRYDLLNPNTKSMATGVYEDCISQESQTETEKP